MKYSLHTITVALTVQGGTAGGRGLNRVDVTHWDLVDLKSKNWTRQTSFSNDQGSIKNSLIIDERQKQKQQLFSLRERVCFFVFCFFTWWSLPPPAGTLMVQWGASDTDSVPDSVPVYFIRRLFLFRNWCDLDVNRQPSSVTTWNGTENNNHQWSGFPQSGGRGSQSQVKN